MTWRIELLLLCLVSAVTGAAQTQITVLDDDRIPLVHAHITYSDLSGQNEGMILTGTDGVAELPMAFARNYDRAIIVVTFIGFSSLTDTVLTNDQQIEYVLDPEDQLLNQFVVTAQYAPNSPEKAVHKVRIIDRKKIERMAAVNLEDVLTNEVNIRISQDAILGSGVSMQGISGENVKIMIDGVPIIGRQDGNLDLNQINLNDIERIEIIEGPLSVNYGTSALAGTINLITKKEGKEKTAASIQSYYETIGSFNLSGSIARQFGKARLSMNAGRNYFNGWSANDPINPDFENPVADSSRFKSWKPREQYFGRAQLHYRIKGMQLGYRFEYFDEKITNRGRPRAPYFETAFDDYYFTQRLDNSLQANGELSKGVNLNIVAAYNRFERQKNTYLTDLTTLDQTLVQTAGAQDTSTFDLWMSRGSVSLTKDSSNIHWEIGYDVNYETAVGRRIEDNLQGMGDYALFATGEWKPWENLTIRPGLRWTYNTAYSAPLTPSVNLAYRVKKWTVRAAYARGFRAPSLKELYFYFVDVNHNIVGNPDLKAEQSHNYSASIRRPIVFRQNILQFEAGVFHNDIKNLISLAISNPEKLEYSHVNIGRSRTQGANTAVSVMHEHFKANVGLAYIGVNSALANSENSSAFDYYPEVTANVTYGWKKVGIDASLFYKYQGQLPITALNDNEELIQNYVDAYHTLDATLSRTFFNRAITLAAGAKNLLNVQNVNFNTGRGSAGGVHASGGTSVPVSTGRFYFLKIDLRWQQK